MAGGEECPQAAQGDLPVGVGDVGRTAARSRLKNGAMLLRRRFCQFSQFVSTSGKSAGFGPIFGISRFF